MTNSATAIALQAQRTVVALRVLTAMLVTVGALIVWAELREPDQFAPLHYDNPQTVTSRVEGLAGAPATHIDDTVDVTGTKCTDEEISVVSVVSWKPVEPRGSSVPIGDAHGAIRERGCTTTRFQNDIPPDVVTAVQSQYARGYEAPLWIITGAETPTDEDGQEGATEVWVTEPFAIVP